VRVSPSLIRRAAASGSSGVEIMPLPGDKALSIVAPTRAEVDEILARASEIDASSLSDEKITRSFALRWCDPEQIARDMIDMLDQRAPARAGEETDAWSWETGPEIGKDITALPSVTTRTVIVVAPPAKMTAAAHLIQMFEDLADPGNVAAEAEQPVEFYTPTYLSAAECLDATNKYLDAVYGAFSERPVTLSVFNRTLVLKGKRRHFDMIKQILTEEIDTAKTAEALDATRAITFVKVPSNVQQEVLFKLLESSLDLDIDIEGIQGEEAVPDEVLVPEVKVIRPEKAAAGTPER
jgi:hypothetical protein